MKAGTTSVFIVLFFLLSLKLNTEWMNEWMHNKFTYTLGDMLFILIIFAIVFSFIVYSFKEE